MTDLLSLVPLAALLTMFVASVLRGAAVARSSGDQAFAFLEALGRQRIAGLAFAVSIAVIGLAAARGALGWQLASDALVALGAAIAVIGTSIVIVAQIQMGRAWRVGVRPGDAPLFVRHGLFRYSRNPIFLGMILTGFGVCLSSGAWWSWAALIVFIVACEAQVRIEEAHLAGNFGKDYQDFRRKVPRWFGI